MYTQIKVSQCATNKSVKTKFKEYFEYKSQIN